MRKINENDYVSFTISKGWNLTVNEWKTALFKGKRIDTMRSTMKWVDARTSWGKLKFPNLGELYARCFPGETFHAHDALDDTKAVARCLPVILELGLVELKVKEYPEETAEQAKPTDSAAKIAADSAKKFGASPKTAGNGPILDANEKDDKLPVQAAKAPQIENLKKITDAAAELLDQNDF